jgi:hypothetical protein
VYFTFSLGTTVTNQNLIPEEIKRRLNSGTLCYNSGQNLLSSRLMSKNKSYNIKTIILPMFFYGCETLSLKTRGNIDRGCLRTVLRRIFGPKRDEVIGYGRKLHNEELLN